MDFKAKTQPVHGKDPIDTLSSQIRYGSPFEATLEGQRNILIEKYPYIVGYAFLGGAVLLAYSFHLTTFMMSFLFLFFISDFMTNDVHRFVPVVPKALLFSVLYILVTLGITLLTYRAFPAMAKRLPDLVNQLQTQLGTQLKDLSQEWNLTQYVDVEQIRGAIIQASTSVLRFLMDSLSPLYKGFIQFVFALVINVFFYHDLERIRRDFNRSPNSMMSFLFQFSEVRLKIFYFYFKRVMGGQVIIAIINTVISSVVILALGLPHALTMIFIVFFCGIFPVVGNLVSNSVLVINAFVSIGPWGAGVCLILLISVHKLEYFLNSRIIGGIVRLPMTVSLAALIFCEVLLGIPGLILAIPMALFARHELEHIPAFAKGSPEEGEP